MIPKIIHYCWISGDKKPNNIQRCMNTWREVLPEYEVVCWDKGKVAECSIPYVEEAIAVKQYAFAADYIRLYALYTYGGIYLDSDVEVLRPFDVFLSDRFFSGTEAAHQDKEIGFNIEAAIMGSEKGHPFLRECMKYYENRHFIHEDGELDNKYSVMPWVISSIANDMYGYDYQNKDHQFPDGVTIYSTDKFTNNLCLEEFLTNNTYAIHRNAASWKEMEHRGWLFHFCRKHNLMSVYQILEKNYTR